MSNTATRSREGVLTLLALEGVGVKTARSLAEAYPTIEEVQDAATRANVPQLKRVPPALANKASWQAAMIEAERILDRASELGVCIHTLYDEEFPVLLRHIPDPPLVLYVKGRLRAGKKHVACIGTREPSEFGQCVTKRLTRLLADHGWSIVSGLAVGVDTLAHREALAAKGHTVAILANGLDKVYPRENVKLAEEIVAAGGALVSEQGFGVPAAASNLVQRDRLQCGMSIGTFVMQTDLVGGSMHTVRFTLLQGRLLFAPVPTGVHAAEEKSRGIIALASSLGEELVDKVKNPPPEYRELLRTRFRATPVARPIHSRDDYPAVLAELDRALTAEEPRNGMENSEEVHEARHLAAGQPGLF